MQAGQSEDTRSQNPSQVDSFDIANALLDLSLGQTATDLHDNEPIASIPRTPSPGGLQSDYTINQQSVLVDEPRLVESEPVAVPYNEPTVESKQTSLVILQEACNDHKFSRNIRQKDLETIVERPERTRAAILGILNAKVHLENADRPSLDIHHSSRVGSLGDEAVEDVHGLIYPQDLLRMARGVEEKLARGELEISEKLPYGDLYLAPRSLQALNGCIGAVYDGMDALLAQSTATSEDKTNNNLQGYQTVHVCVRPPGHHAAEASPCGFCWINNVHVAIAYARRKYNVRRAAILDFDLHHGDGSQSIAWTLNEATPNAIGYYSLHDIYSYPCESGNVDKIREASVSIAAHGHHIHNEMLQPYADMNEFEHLYSTRYSRLFQAAEKYLAEGELKGERSIICISAGYDASQYETSSMQRHAVSVPTIFYERFTADTVRLAKRFSNGKVFSILEGGYGDRAITSAATAHMLGLADSEADWGHNSSAYDIERLKTIEKHFPAKYKNNRKSLKGEGSAEPWITQMTKLHEQHLRPHSSEAQNKLDEEQAALLELQRMTLRERKPRATPVATPRAPRATPRATPAVKHGEAETARRIIKLKMPPLPSMVKQEVRNGQDSTSVQSRPVTAQNQPTPQASTFESPTSVNLGTPTPKAPARERDIYDFPP